MNNKIVSTQTTSAIFLAIVLFTGTITAISSSSSFMRSAQAQSSYYYDGGIDTRYNSYEPPQYPSYKPDYKAKYSSDNNNYKSKDSKSVSLNKIKCINTNLNINGNNAGNVSIGNKDAAADGGYVGAYSSSDGSGYGDDGYNKQGKGFDCIINNNNNNTNVVVVGGNGNVTDGNGNVTACEECFFNLTLNSMQLNRLLTAVQVTSLGEYCDRLASTPNSSQETQSVILALHQAFASPIPPEQNDSINVIIACLIDARVIGPRWPEICSYGFDNNDDGLIDCDDPDCSSFPQCMTWWDSNNTKILFFF